MDQPPGDFQQCLDTARILLGDGEDGASLWDANDLVNRALALDPDAADFDQRMADIAGHEVEPAVAAAYRAFGPLLRNRQTAASG